MKLIIADDEKVILNGLIKMINLEELDMELVATAEDGKTLYEKIIEFKPDIVISDVKMPEMTGIEVAKKLKDEAFDDVKFIFISGYQEFVYVKEALSEGAVDYLLKPVSAKDLENSIKKAVNLIEKITVYDIFNRESEGEIESIIESINSESEFDKERLIETFKDAKIDAEDKVLVGLTVGIVPGDVKRLKNQSLSTYQLKKFSLFSKFYDVLKKKGQAFIVKNEEEYMCMICVFEKKDKNVFFEKHIQDLRSSLEKEFELELRMGIGNIVTNIKDIKDTYHLSIKAFNTYFFEERNIMYAKDIKKQPQIPFNAYNDGIEKIFKSIVAKDGKFLKNVDMFLIMLKKIHYGNEYAVKARIMYFTGEIGVRLSNYRLLKTDFYVLQDALQKEIEEKDTFRECHAAVMKYYESIAAEICHSEKHRDKSSIEKIKKYIKENYKEDITMKELAKMSSVSENYFSAMFKRETGKNYKTYLTDVRMEAAINLLMTSDMKAYEIGFEVGYNNARRFVDTFKERYGISPSEYKKRLKNQ